MADLPDINSFSEEETRALSVCVLRALCDAHGAPSAYTNEQPTTKEFFVTYLKRNVMGKDIPWIPRLSAFKQRQRDSFHEFFEHQNDVHRRLKIEQQRIRQESDFLASIAADVEAAPSISFPAIERLVTRQEAILNEEFVCEMEAQSENLADLLLPKSATEILQDFLNGFMDRESAPGAAQQEDAVHTRYACIIFLSVCAVLTYLQIAQFERGAEGTMVRGALGVSPSRPMAYSRTKFVVEHKSEGILEGTFYTHVMIYMLLKTHRK
jgi:hypothetical protein